MCEDSNQSAELEHIRTTLFRTGLYRGFEAPRKENAPRDAARA